MIEDNLLEKSYHSNMSPQVHKNAKNSQLCILNKRLSLMKRHLKK